MCLKGATNLCVNRPYPTAGVYPYFTGTYADYLYLPPGHPIFTVPDSIPSEVLAPVNCATGTVTQGLISAGAHQGQSVVIQGAGGLGLTEITLAGLLLQFMGEGFAASATLVIRLCTLWFAVLLGGVVFFCFRKTLGGAKALERAVETEGDSLTE